MISRTHTQLQTIIASFVTTIIWGEDRGRARAPWRILAPLIPAVLFPRIVGLPLVDLLPAPGLFLVVNLMAAFVVLVVVAVSTRYLDQGRSIWEYGLVVDRRWIGDLLAGVIIGFTAVTLPVVVGIYTEVVDIVAVFERGEMAFWVGLVLVVLAFVCVSLSEELLYRGVVQTNAVEGLWGKFSPRWAIVGGLVVSALIFTPIHGGQPSHPAYLVTWFLAGLIFGILYLLSGDLALPIGVHMSLNTGFAGLFVRTDIAGADRLSAIARIEPASQSALFGYGGVIEVSAFLTAGLFAGLWVWYSRDSMPDPWTHPNTVLGEAGR